MPDKPRMEHTIEIKTVIDMVSSNQRREIVTRIDLPDAVSETYLKEKHSDSETSLLVDKTHGDKYPPDSA